MESNEGAATTPSQQMKELVEQHEDFLRMTGSIEEEPSGPFMVTCRWMGSILGFFLLLPVRIVLVLFLATLFWLCCFISEACLGNSLRCCLCCSSANTHVIEPHTAKQRAFLRLSGVLCRLILLTCGYIWIPVRGLKGSAKDRLAGDGKPIPTVVANHVTPLDGMFLNHVLGGQITGVAKHWVTRLPLVHTLGAAHHVLPVGGPGGRGAQRVVPISEETGETKTSPAAAKRPATEVIMEYQKRRAQDPRLFPLLIFPEGTTKAERCLLRFATGAFVAGEPVQPVVLRFPHRLGRDPSWTRGAAACAMRILTTWVNFAEVLWLPVQQPTDEERQKPKLFAERVQALMAEAMALPPERVSQTISLKEMNDFRSRK